MVFYIQVLLLTAHRNQVFIGGPLKNGFGRWATLLKRFQIWNMQYIPPAHFAHCSKLRGGLEPSL